MKLVDNIVKWVGFAGAVVGIFWFAIANPDIVNEQFYDAVNRALPFLMLAFGVMVGFSLRDSMKRRDAEADARIEQMRLDREAERKRLDADAQAERNRLEAESDARIRAGEMELDRRMARGDEDMRSQAARVTAFLSLTEKEAGFVLKIADSAEGRCYTSDSDMIVSLMVKKAAYTTDEWNSTKAVSLTPQWQVWLAAFRDEFETVRANAQKGGRVVWFQSAEEMEVPESYKAYLDMQNGINRIGRKK